ncbi:MAG: ATP-binding protein [Rubrimonas sp.]
MIFKEYLPRSLFGRSLLILVGPLVLLQLVVAAVFVERHIEAVTRQIAGSTARELNYAIDAVEQAANAADGQRRLDALAGPLGMTLTLSEGDSVPSETLRRFYDIAGGAVEQTLKSDLRRPLALEGELSDRELTARILTDKGVLTARIDRRRLSVSNAHQLFVITLAAAMALLVVAVIFLRNQIRPIRALAAAADAFGKGRAVPFQPAGAEEVRRAGAAFLSMRASIERQIESRTRMLSGVSHDLRTPLTRMKLALAMLEADGADTQDMEADIRAMERMIDEFLAFARQEAGEEPEAVDPRSVAEQAVAAARRSGGAPELRDERAGAATDLVTMRAGAVARALGNLLDNALSFGTAVSLTLRASSRHLEFEVEDDGPGIPAARREEALKPFARLDVSRNQDRGAGVGLGLSIAAEVARAHGGALILGESARLGGLSARLRLPR